MALECAIQLPVLPAGLAPSQHSVFARRHVLSLVRTRENASTIDREASESSPQLSGGSDTASCGEDAGPEKSSPREFSSISLGSFCRERLRARPLGAKNSGT